MSYLIIVSNRGPFSFSNELLRESRERLKAGKRPRSPGFGEGGLVQAMAGLLKEKKWNTTWLGSSMGDRDIDVARGHYNRLFKRMIRKKYAPNHFPYIEIDPGNRMHFKYKGYDFYMRFVFFDTKHMHSYYSKFANGFLWPLMHLTRSPLFYKNVIAFPRPQFEKNDFVQYISSGVTFANTIIDEIRKTKDIRKKEDQVIVWNQDYHLMRIAEVCKALLIEEGISTEERRTIHMGQFIHTPFFNIHEIQGLIREDKRNRVKAKRFDPFVESMEVALQKLTWGLLSNDFIGFHTREYCDNYLEALEEWFPVKIKMEGRFYEVEHQDGVTTIGAFPIGLDVDKILSETSKGKKLKKRIGKEGLADKIENDRKRGKYVFGGLERRDYTKGLVERLSIFYHVFNNLKRIKRDARFYQVTAPSRSENQEYQSLYSVLKKEVEKVNRELDGEPIVHIDKGLSPPQNYRFIKLMDVMLVTPLEDGMNLVAFEYILSQKYKSPDDRGILVISTSGASRVLKQKGFGEEDGIIYVNAMKPKVAGEKIANALIKGRHLSDEVINYVETERRVDTWAESNIESILNCRKLL
jgi:trehalose-6-phosphate synthase